MSSTSGITVLASDFSTKTTDPLRNVWTGGKLRAVAAVLQPGELVGLVVDSQTGHTAFGVELLGANGGTMHNPSDHARVLYHHSDGTTHERWHYGRNLGPIFAERSAVKWNALSWWREQGRLALDVVRPVAEAEHGQTYGAWTYALTLHGVHVKYEPQRPEAGPIGYGEVVDGQLRRWSTYGGYEGPHGSYRDLPAHA